MRKSTSHKCQDLIPHGSEEVKTAAVRTFNGTLSPGHHQ